MVQKHQPVVLLSYVPLEGKSGSVYTMAVLLIHLALLPSMASRMHQYRWSTCLLSHCGSLKGVQQKRGFFSLICMTFELRMFCTVVYEYVIFTYVFECPQLACCASQLAFCSTTDALCACSSMQPKYPMEGNGSSSRCEPESPASFAFFICIGT